MITLEIISPNIQRFAKSIGSLNTAWKHSGKAFAAWEKAHREMAKISEQLFLTQGSSGAHGRWKAYTGAELRYLAMKKSILGASEAKWLLMWGFRKERLGRSLWDINHPDHEWSISSDMETAEFGTRVPYAAGHHKGTARLPKKYGGGPIPQRRIWDPTPRQTKELAQIVTRVMLREWRKTVHASVEGTSG